MPPLANGPSLHLALPQLLLGAGVLVVLALGLVLPRLSRQLAAAVTVAVLAAAGAAALATAAAPAGLFAGLLARDPFADYFTLIAVFSTAVVTLLALGSRDALDPAAPDREAPELFALLLAAALGVTLMAAATDLLLGYLGLELVSIVGYVLAGFTRGSRRSAEASLKYVVYGGVASGAFLYGLSLLYGLAGSTSFAAVAAVTATAPPLALAAAAGLCLAGFGYKVAVVPFHMWAPDVYEGAPTPVAAFLSVASKAGGFALALRFLAAAAAATSAASGGGRLPWSLIALVIAILSMTVGNLAALAQRNLKRLLAYSSIAHAGYVFLGLAAGAPAGHHAVLFYLGVYTFMNLAAFAAVVAVASRGGGETVDEWAGLGRRMPLAAFTVTVAFFALAGLPPTAGFIGKYYLFAAVVERGRASGGGAFYVAALVAVANSVLSLYYYARVIRAVYIERGEGGVAPQPAPRLLQLVLLALVVPVVALGVYWAPLEALASDALTLWAPALAP
jgi:NADH-quinone oxidoreductase subunit N